MTGHILKSPDHNRRTRSGALLTLSLLALVAIFYPTNGRAELARIVDQEVVQALLAENWGIVAEGLLGSVDTQTASPVHRLLKGHACLALNRNNESLCLFLSVTSDDNVNEWEEWTQAFAKKNPESAIACYFRGDALARLKHWEAATKAFKDGIKSQPKHSLLLNARGVVYAVIDSLELAVTDFDSAATANPSLADAFANLGTRRLQKKGGAKGALKWFDSALNLSPDFYMALRGRACALFARGKEKKAQQAFGELVGKVDCVSQLTRDDLASILNHQCGDEGIMLAELRPEQVGTRLDTRWNNLKENPSTWNYNRFVSDLRGQTQELQNHYMDKLKNYSAANLDWSGKLNNLAQNNASLNRPGGTAEGWSRLLDTSLNIVGSGGSLPGQAKHRIDVTRGNYNLSTRIDNLIPDNTIRGPSKIGGVTTNLSHSHYQSWPFQPRYGLCYGPANNNTELVTK